MNNLIKLAVPFCAATIAAFSPSQAMPWSDEIGPSEATFASKTENRVLGEEGSLPDCGSRIGFQEWGPVTDASTHSQSCLNTYPGTGKYYMALDHYKKKYIHENGSWWKCVSIPRPDPKCHTYYRPECPDDTCGAVDEE